MSPVCPIWPRIANLDSHDALVLGTKDPSYSEKTLKYGRERLEMKRCQNTLVVQMVKNLPVMPENWVQSLGWKDPLEKEMAVHATILTWKIPWTEKHSPMAGHKESDMTERLTRTRTHTHTHTHSSSKT